MAVSKCTRDFSRDTGLTAADWRKFFKANTDAWVYLARSPADGIDKLTEQHIKAFITDVEFSDTGFSYTLNLMDGWTEEDHMEFVIQPVYGLMVRNGKFVAGEISLLEFIPL